MNYLKETESLSTASIPGHLCMNDCYITTFLSVGFGGTMAKPNTFQNKTISVILMTTL